MSATLETQREEYNEETGEIFYGIYAVEVTAEANAEDAEPAYAEYEVYGIGKVIKRPKGRGKDYKFQYYHIEADPKYAVVGDMVRFKDISQPENVYVIGVVNKVGIKYIDITPISYKIDEDDDEYDNNEDWGSSLTRVLDELPKTNIPIQYLENDSMWYNTKFYHTHSFIADDYIPFTRSSSKKYELFNIHHMYKLKQK